MARELITSWADFQLAFDRLLNIASHKVLIYDEDLSSLKLESPPRLAQLNRILQNGKKESLQIAVRKGALVGTRHPKLLKLLTTYSHQAYLQQTPSELAHLRDSMIVVDGKHGLIRFERDMPRSKLLIDEDDEIRPYLNRFNEIFAAGGENITSSTLGL